MTSEIVEQRIDLDFFKKLLNQKKQEALERIANLGSRVNECSTETKYPYHMADQGTDAQEREKTFHFIAREEIFLRKIESALERIENGTYGICQKCGKPIPVERLKVVPVTGHCVSCKNGSL